MHLLFRLFVWVAALALLSCGERPKPDGASESASHSAEQHNRTLDSLNALIAADPGNYLHYLARARFFSERENFEEAFRDIDRAMRADSTQSAIYLLRGELHFNRQDIRAAYDAYKACLGVQPNDIQCLLKKSAIDITLGNYEIAMEQINNVLRQDELLAEPYYLKGRLYKQAGDTTLAASSYQTAIERDPDFYDAYIEVGLLYAEKKHDLAREYYNTAISLRPKSIEAWYNKAMFLQETGSRDARRYQEAFACYDSILRIDSLFAPAWFNKGFIHLQYLRSFDKGIPAFSSALRLNPQYYQAMYNRGLCYEALGSRKQAEADYRQALAIQPDYTDAARALSRVLGE